MLLDRFASFAAGSDGSSPENGVSRRTFLKASAAAGGGLLVSVTMPKAIGDAEAADADGFAPDAFIRIDRSGQVTLIIPQVEMGQGTYTSMPMLIAEELEVELKQVRVEHAPPDDRLYANPALGFQATGGSTSVRAFWKPLRMAGATARSMLVSAAAASWQTDASSCRAEKGEVIHAPTGRKLAYGVLVDKAATLPTPNNVALKAPKDFKLIGTSAKRLDSPEKVNGRAEFGIDVKIPGMKIAAVAACPVIGGKLVRLDDSKAKTIRGVLRVIRLEDAVAVVADHMWAAKKGLAALDVTWDGGENAHISTADIVKQLEDAADRPAVIAKQDGDVAKTMAGAAKTVEAIYELPFLAHATMEPMNCTVHVRKDGCDVWVGTQIAARARATAAAVTGLPVEKVHVHNRLLGGGFGRRLDVDGVTRAVQIARHVDFPVKVVWSREEDIQQDIYRPYYYGRLAGGLNENGLPIAWSHRVVGSSILARWAPPAFVNGLDFGRCRRHRRSLRISEPSRGLCPPGAAAGTHHRLVARRRRDAQCLHGRRLHRRTGRDGEDGPGRLSARLARKKSPHAGRARPRSRKSGMVQSLARGFRSRRCGDLRLWKLHCPSRRGRCRQGRNGARAARRLRGGLRPNGQSRHRQGANGGRDHFRDHRGALWRNHLRERPRRAKQFRQLSNTAYRRGAGYRGPHHRQQRGPRRNRRAGDFGYRAGHRECDLRRDGQKIASAADQPC